MPAIVTRPAQEAQSWAARLRAQGVDAVALPLIAIDPPVDAAPLRAAWRQLPDWRALMFVSGNAVRHFFLQAPPSAQFAGWAWAPGPGTADALREAGVPDACVAAPAPDEAQFDSETLWRRVAHQLRPGDRVLVVRGGDAHGQSRGRDWLGDQLAAAGVQVDTVVAYRRRAPSWSLAEQELARRGAGDGSVWLFSSSEAVGHLRTLLPRQDWQAAHALATHARIAQAASALGFGDVRVCRPAFDEVLASLQSPR